MNDNKRAGKKRRRDRLSRLPEPIIYHILSFLDTKCAVQTSVLSRSWRCAWKHVPALDLNQYSFQLYSSFHRYVDKVLSLRYPVKLRKVRFVDDECRSDSEEGRDDDLVIRVIRYALSHDAQHLVIYNGNDIISTEIYVFSHLFGSVSDSSCNLKRLRLSGFELDSGFGSPGFRMLTTLDLVTCLFVFDREVIEPFSNFPCLKYLVLCDCHSEKSPLVDETTIKIYGPELLSLKLDSIEIYGMDIDAPKLKFLSIREDEAEYLSFSNLSLPSLDHADIGLHGDLGLIEEVKEDLKPQLISLFQGLHNATSLKLYRDTTVPVLSKFCGLLQDEPSPFLRLKSLILDSEIENVPYKLVHYFFKGSSCASPNIQYISPPRP